MKSDPPTCKLLVLVIVLLVNHSTGELEYYQDVESEPSEDVNLKYLERFLESQGYRDALHRPHISHLYPPIYVDDLREYVHQKMLESLRRDQLENLNYPVQSSEFNYIQQYPRSIERDRSYVNLGTPSRNFKYPQVNVPYSDNEINEKVYYNNPERIPIRQNFPGWENPEADDLNNNPLGNLEDQILNADVSQLQENFKQVPRLTENKPEFTYSFNDPKLNEINTFAVKPNDPRYYEEEPIVIANEEKSSDSIENPSQDIEGHGEKKKTSNENKINFPRSESDTVDNSKFSHFKGLLSEPQRQTNQDPIITPSNYKLSNDVYFIAIVAGCSAAAMFALVLIGLTWCRLQRGAKAAADIEYPAYGVTGPNKDILPSGDQRLAHSAQMYHFQHQKQQIIAMEKTAARDPGSVSEVESDEENEEGDYTVYECPGLAPAGEMEVKNPLFHDDPTPATPPVNHKEGNRQHH
ncbi:protein cab-1 [Chelonus insularis]|uniref:protein cab-1 n=1 Tax=Chelonus insularis TaxID=460826 RepID=UPI00158B768F|nr:protein cab-1 [Chelonus insularis]